MRIFTSASTEPEAGPEAGLQPVPPQEPVALLPEGSDVANYAFDVTPARLVTALITERGVVKADAGAMRVLAV